MRLYNSLSRKKEEFRPEKEILVKMFVCGPTVYDLIHIGNARTFVFFDFAAKYLRFKGYRVKYIQNITDIDDRIIKRAAESGKKPAELAREFEEKFLQNIRDIGIDSVDEYVRATDNIPEIISQVERLVEKGNAYLIEGDGWYFDVKTFSEYGRLSGRTVEMAEDGVSRIDENEKKRNRSDFCLWKISKPGEPVWDSKLGKGRPGWHIEDTAITEKYLGFQYDIHGGGQDLMFPHHEAEIAQQASATGIKAGDFVKYWLHTGFLINKNEKMSKSFGNFMTLAEALTKYSPQVLRFYFLSAHYRSPLDFNEKSLLSAEAAVQRIWEFTNRISHFSSQSGDNLNDPSPELEEILSRLEEALEDDLDTPRAFSFLFDYIRKANQKLSEKNPVVLSPSFINLLNVFGILLPSGQIPPENVQILVRERENAREEGDYGLADNLRMEIAKLGYQIDDTDYGSLLKKKV
jgi:cysteinyl-tRNA synthetase